MLRRLFSKLRRGKPATGTPVVSTPQSAVDASFLWSQMTPDQVRRLLAHARDRQMTDAERAAHAARVKGYYGEHR
jgi:hypothetical protein